MSLAQHKYIDKQHSWKHISLRVLSILLAFIAFLFALNLMTATFGIAGRDYTKELISVTSNPFIGLLIGILSAAVMQSSSTITSILVALVGAGTLSFSNAIPIVMGANIGTTVTSTIVSLSYLGSPKTFKKAIGAASLHDFFNLFTVILIFPLEYMTGFLTKKATWITELITDNTLSSHVIDHQNSVEKILKILSLRIEDHTIIYSIISILLLILSLKTIASLTKAWLPSKQDTKIERLFFNNRPQSILSGFVLTAATQSSSLTSSLIVPLVASSKIQLPKAMFFLMGANVGTTVTALIAAFSTDSFAAIAIAIAHLLFNVIGAVLFSLPLLRVLPVWYAKKIGDLVAKNRMFGFSYIILLFFALPFFLIWVSKLF